MVGKQLEDVARKLNEKEVDRFEHYDTLAMKLEGDIYVFGVRKVALFRNTDGNFLLSNDDSTILGMKRAIQCQI